MELVENIPAPVSGVTLGCVMIAKNEAHVLERCMKSMVRAGCEHFILCDNGSTDRTKDVFVKFLRTHCLSGQLWTDQWDDFSTNRNRAMNVADQSLCKWLWMMDCDDYWAGWSVRERLDQQKGQDTVLVPLLSGNHKYERPDITARGCGHRYTGIRHNFLQTSKPHGRPEWSPADFVHSTREGGRKRAYDQDIAVFLRDDTPRGRFYLAQSYWDANKKQEALRWYSHRALMESGWSEEACYSSLRCAYLAPESSIFWYLCAHAWSPRRWEPILGLVESCEGGMGWIDAALDDSARLNRPPRALFTDAREWLFYDRASVAAYKYGHPGVALALSYKLTQIPLNLPWSPTPNNIDRQERNREFFLRATLKGGYLQASIQAVGLPHMKPHETVQWMLAIRNVSTYWEYGGGASSAWAKLIGVKCVHVVDNQQKYLLGDVNHMVEGCGRVGEWGWPEHKGNGASYCFGDELQSVAPDVVLVDGRWRRSCILTALRRCPPRTKVLCHDSQRYRGLVGVEFTPVSGSLSLCTWTGDAPPDPSLHYRNPE